MEIYNGKLMDEMDIIKTKKRERLGFSAGCAGSFGRTKAEWNSMIGSIKNSLENKNPLIEAFFPFAN